MKARIFIAVILSLLAAACSPKSPEISKAKPEAKPEVRLTLLPQDEITPGRSATVLAKLNLIKERSVLSEAQLETVHTQKFHLLVIDPTLTDYQHIHPQPTDTPGLYRFTFTPQLPGGYRAWADVTPKATGKQSFAMADLGHPRAAKIDKAERHEVVVDGYRFTLTFDTPPVAGGESMGTIAVADARGPVKGLQPVMGAYAHIVGFYDDFYTVIHTHPMGEEPKTAQDRGGPELMFHLAPQKAGFVKLFAQVKIGGRDIFAPFGVNIQ